MELRLEQLDALEVAEMSALEVVGAAALGFLAGVPWGPVWRF